MEDKNIDGLITELGQKLFNEHASIVEKFDQNKIKRDKKLIISNYKYELDMQNIKTKNKDIYFWLNVHTRYPNLKKRLRSKIIELIGRVSKYPHLFNKNFRKKIGILSNKR